MTVILQAANQTSGTLSAWRVAMLDSNLIIAFLSVDWMVLRVRHALSGQVEVERAAALWVMRLQSIGRQVSKFAMLRLMREEGDILQDGERMDEA